MNLPHEPPAEDSIKVVCRFRPLNDAEEKAGSKFIAKFPPGTEECLSMTVSLFDYYPLIGYSAMECLFHELTNVLNKSCGTYISRSTKHRNFMDKMSNDRMSSSNY